MFFKGAPYPIVDDPMGYFRTQSGIDQIKSDLIILLLTNPGERVMLPEFGTPLRELVFEPNDFTLANRAREMIANSISLFEPRITITQIEVTNGHDDRVQGEESPEEQDHILFIRIMFVDPENIRDVQELKLEVPLGSAS